MAHKLAAKSQQIAYRILALQLLITIVIALLFLLDDRMAMVSSFVGGLICLIPNTIFVLMTHRHGGAQSAKKIINAYYLGEAVKLFSTAALFAVAFIYLPIKVLPLLLTYIGCLLGYFGASLFTTGSGNMTHN